MSVIYTDKDFIVDNNYTTHVPSPDINPGWTFQGWSTSPAGPSEIAGGARYDPPSDITLYAQWKKNEVPVHIIVYSWNGDYSMSFVEPDGTTHYTTAAENDIVFTQSGAGQLKVVAPGILIQALDGQTFNGRSGYVNLDGSTSERTLSFTIGEFSTLYVSKMPVQQILKFNSKSPTKKNVYNSAGTLFGGHKYTVHWYNYRTFRQNGSTSTSTAYTFSREDACFVNTAHKGLITSHKMHIWIGFEDMQDKHIYELSKFIKTGMKKADTWTANFYTCSIKDGAQSSVSTEYINAYVNLEDYGTSGMGQGELVLDFRNAPPSYRFQLGYSIKDNADGGCAGIMFSGQYVVYLADDDCGDCCVEGIC